MASIIQDDRTLVTRTLVTGTLVTRTLGIIQLRTLD